MKKRFCANNENNNKGMKATKVMSRYAFFMKYISEYQKEGRKKKKKKQKKISQLFAPSKHGIEGIW